MTDPAHNGREKEGEVERIYRLLKGWLVECTLAPGEFLAEVDLARRCETSRTPIREACNRLAQDGWISRIRHKGYLVTPVSVRDRFHLAVAEIAGSQRMLDQLRLTLEYVQRPDKLSIRHDQISIPHAEILEALESRRSGDARQPMAAHIDYARDRMLRLFAT